MSLDDEPSRNLELIHLLQQAGFAYGTRSAVNLQLLFEHFSVEALLKVTLAALHTASPDMALNGFERLASLVDRDHLMPVLNNRKRLNQFMVLCGASPFLTNLIFKEPTFFSRLLNDNELESSRSRVELLTTLRRNIPDAVDIAGLMKALRGFKRFEMLRIAARDLNGLAALEEVTRELSDLASATLQVAYETCHRLLVQEYGMPLKHTPEGSRQALMTILGMGKFGGRELNFSSDIDIIYFYETTKGKRPALMMAGVDAKGYSLCMHSLTSWQSRSPRL